MNIEKVDVSPDLVGESPVWDGASGRLFWIDALAGRVRALNPLSGRHESWSAPDRIGSIALATGNCLLLALRTQGFRRLDLATSKVTPLASLPSQNPNAVLNDGKTDRRGRFVCGSMSISREPAGEIYRFTAPDTIEILASGIRLSNCICFSPAGHRMYWADSLSRTIQVCHYDPAGTAVSEPHCLFDGRASNSIPDGATVDSEGHLWVALPRTAEIARITPDGEIAALIRMPIEFPSCPAFGGENLDVLYVTSIRDSGTGRAASSHPDAGSVLAITGLGVRGIQDARFPLPPP